MKIRDRRKTGWFWLDNDTVDHLGATLGPYAFHAYVALARMSNNDTQAAFPSLNTLSQKLKVSKNTIIKSLRTLESHGVIHIIVRTSESGDAESNEYILLDREEWQLPLLGSAPDEPPSAPDEPRVVHEVNHGSAPDEPRVVHEVNPNNTNREQDLIKETKLNKDYSSPFLSFWATYPRKEAKGAAWKIWKREKLDRIADRIITSVEQHTTWPQWQRDEGKFIPHPATYLSQRRWEDQQPQSARANDKQQDWIDQHPEEIGPDGEVKI